MSHLSPAEFIDLVERTLPAGRAMHLDTCAECRAQADTVADVLQSASATTPIPEPSPVYWDQLSARVRDAIAEPAGRSIFGYRVAHMQPLAAAVVAGVLLFSGALLVRNSRPQSVPSVEVAAPAGYGDRLSDPALDPNHAAEWAVLTAAAADVHIDEVRDAGMAVHAGTVDQAVAQLSRDELSELGRLLQSELKHSSN